VSDETRRRLLCAIGAGGLLALAAARAGAQLRPQPPSNDGGPFVPTPWPIVDEMLKLVEIRPTDVVYDLGSGDGRFVIAAAKRHGARGVGVELNGDLVVYSRVQAERDGVADRVSFVEGDVLKADVREATVVTMYLLPRLAVQLVPKLRAELAAGTRIVAHDYALEPWRPDKTVIFDVEEKVNINGMTETKLFYYVVPAQVDGRWQFVAEQPISARPVELAIEQWPDRLEGAAIVDGVALALRDLSVRAERIRFDLLHAGRMLSFRGQVTGVTMAGEMEGRGGTGRWTARRLP
jgi:ubiquinone/menaquinone biosynthesis C-methylase UbiE